MMFGALAWLTVYWLIIGPLLITGCFLLSAFLSKAFRHGWLGVILSGLLGATITLWFTWAVAADLAQKLAFNRRLKRPNRPPPRMLRLTVACFLFEVALLVATPFLVYGLLILLLD